MMRHRADGPHALMDFLFLKLFEYNKAQGFRYFSLGPAPIVALPANEPASLEEKTFYHLTHYMNSLFSMTGLRNYKAKFATQWQPLYLIHGRVTDWPRVLRAFTDLTELPENHQPLLSREHRQQFFQISGEIIAEIRRTGKRQATKERGDNQ